MTEESNTSEEEESGTFAYKGAPQYIGDITIGWDRELTSNPNGMRNPFSVGFSYHPHGTSVVAVSPDGKWVAFGGWDETVQVCELVVGGRSFTYHGHQGLVSTVSWSPDGIYIASGSNGDATRDIQVWEAATGNVVFVSRSDEAGVRALAWSPDGSRIAIGAWDNTVRILNALTGELFLTYQRHTARVAAVAWSTDGSRIASGSLDGTVQVWDASSGTSICTYLGHYGGVNSVAWSPDGAYVASGGDDTTAQVWNASTKEPLFTYSYHSERVMTVCWSGDGKRVRSGSWDGTVREWNALNGGNVSLYTPPLDFERKTMPIAWNPDATSIAMGLEDRRVAVADMVDGRLFLCRAPSTPVELLGQVDKEQATTTTQSHSSPRQGRQVNVWGGIETEVITYRGHAGAVKSVAWSPDNTRIASGGYDSTIQIWDAATGKTLSTYRGHLDPVVAVSWSPDGKRLISGSLDKTIKVWDIATNRLLSTYGGHSAAISSVASAPVEHSSSPSNVARVTSASEDGTVQVWNTERGEVSLNYRGHSSPVETVAWSPDGHFVASGGVDKTVRVWDSTTGEDVCIYQGHTGIVSSVAWSPDGKRIASGSDWGRTIQVDGTLARDDTPTVHIWDALTGSSRITCDNGRHHVRICAVAWSPDDRYVASCDIFGRVEVYDSTTGEEIAIVFGHLRGQNQLPGQALALAWSSDGQHIAASFSGGLVCVWPTH